MPHKIFMSYSAEDTEIVYRVWAVLTRIGINAYAYEKFPKPGDPINKSIMNAIRNCRCIIVFLTKTGSNSCWVNQEVGAAVALKKRVIPILERDVDWKGFIGDNIEHISYDPLKPEATISLIVNRLRHLFKLESNIPNGLIVRCETCSVEFSVPLPSILEIENAVNVNKNFNVNCPNTHTVEIVPTTLEPLWLAKKFQKTLFKKKIKSFSCIRLLK